MSSTASLSEPRVLAHTKRRLFPDADEPNTYSVVDTQFAMDEWRSGEPIPPDVHERLAPFNHVRVGSGYPDLVGVRLLEPELLAVERFGDQPPLIAVEAKGRTKGGAVDVERGVVQAYDRLHEANAAYLAAPVRAISPSARTLARELNVGVLGIEVGGTVEALEVPRVVGNRTADDATAIRFQATAQGGREQVVRAEPPEDLPRVPAGAVPRRRHGDGTRGPGRPGDRRRPPWGGVSRARRRPSRRSSAHRAR